MHTEIDAGDRVINLTLTVDEAEAFMEGMGTPDEIYVPAIREVVAELGRAVIKLAAPTSCCGLVLPVGHPGCVCALAQEADEHFDELVRVAAKVRAGGDIERFYTRVVDLTEVGREKVARLQEQRQKIAEFYERYGR